MLHFWGKVGWDGLAICIEEKLGILPAEWFGDSQQGTRDYYGFCGPI